MHNLYHAVDAGVLQPVIVARPTARTHNLHHEVEAAALFCVSVDCHQLDRVADQSCWIGPGPKGASSSTPGHALASRVMHWPVRTVIAS